MTGAVAAALAALPDTRHEDWRYTDLAPLKARAWRELAPEIVALQLGDGAPVTQLVELGASPDAARLLTHRIALKPQQRAVLVLHERGGDAPCLALHNLELDLSEGAALDLWRVQQPGAGANLISRLDARIGRDARLRCVGFYAGGTLVRNDLNVALEAPGAAIELHGVLAPAGAEHLDVHTRVEHRAPHGTSREIFRCVVQDRARAVFNGRVAVLPGAAKTDSEQHVDSLLLSPQAEVNAKPELLIETDDVKCAHGATCGQLDEAAIFYLRSRGVPADSARKLLLFTFAHDVLRRIDYEPARQLAERALLARLPGAGALEELL